MPPVGPGGGHNQGTCIFIQADYISGTAHYAPDHE